MNHLKLTVITCTDALAYCIMASTSKGKRSGGGAGSLLDLKAEISKKKEEHQISKAAGVTSVKGVRLKLKGIGTVKNVCITSPPFPIMS